MTVHWIDVFVDEKGYDLEELFEVDGPTGTANIVPLGVVVDAIRGAPAAEQSAIRANIAKLDFADPAAPKKYLRHLAQALAL